MSGVGAGRRQNLGGEQRNDCGRGGSRSDGVYPLVQQAPHPLCLLGLASAKALAQFQGDPLVIRNLMGRERGCLTSFSQAGCSGNLFGTTASVGEER